MKEGIDKAFLAAGGKTEIVGGRVQLATALGVTPQAIHEWYHRGYLPLDRAKQVSEMYDIPLKELVSPDVASAMDTVALLAK